MTSWHGHLLNWNMSEWHESLLDRIELRLHGFESVLDIGCGDGLDVALFASEAALAVGVDLRIQPSDVPAKKAHLVKAHASYLPFRDGIFDVVFEKDALHHMGDVAGTLRESLRVKKKDGRFVAFEANRYNPAMYLRMTLLLGHEHMARPAFENIIASCFPSAKIECIECRAYPLQRGTLLRAVRLVERLIARIPLIRLYLSYNVAVVSG